MKRNQRAKRIFCGAVAVFAASGAALYTWAACMTNSPDGSSETVFLVAALVFGITAAVSAVEAIS